MEYLNLSEGFTSGQSVQMDAAIRVKVPGPHEAHTLACVALGTAEK